VNSTLKDKLSDQICTQCGVCCKLFLINLDETEYRSGRYQTVFDGIAAIEDFDEAVLYGANILAQNDDGSCIYLKDRGCSIHSDRPQVCREYFCSSTEERFQKMHEVISKHKSK